MRKIWLCGAAILIAAMVAGGIAGYAAERRNCLCYIAEHSPGSSIPLDDRVRNEVSGQEITDETMKICTYYVIRKGYDGQGTSFYVIIQSKYAEKG